MTLMQCQSFQKHDKNGQASQPRFKTWDSYVERVAQIQTWTLDAKLGFVYQYKGKQKAINTNLDWHQEDTAFEIVVSGPLGFGRIILDDDENGTRLTNHQGEVFFAEDPETLFLEQTGMSLPWSDLYWWLRGLPAPNKAHQKIYVSSKTFQLRALKQSGWSVEYLEYQMPNIEIGQEMDQSMPQIPRKIRFKKDDISAKIVIRNWALSSPHESIK